MTVLTYTDSSRCSNGAKHKFTWMWLATSCDGSFPIDLTCQKPMAKATNGDLMTTRCYNHCKCTPVAKQPNCKHGDLGDTMMASCLKKGPPCTLWSLNELVGKWGKRVNVVTSIKVCNLSIQWFSEISHKLELANLLNYSILQLRPVCPEAAVMCIWIPGWAVDLFKHTIM